MLEFWQHLPEKMNPVFFNLGPIPIHWYSLMYIIAFTIVYYLTTYRINKGEISITKEQVEDYATWAIIGTIIGGRLGYVLFYDLPFYLTHPLQIILPFDPATGKFTGISGMSYHGGATGVIVATYLFTKKHNLKFLPFMDIIVVSVPIAYTFGRIGNFINNELYGRVTTSPIGMYFNGVLRYPSQLFEAFFEGIVLFLILWPIRNRLQEYPGSLIGIYLIGYGFFRFFIEFFRQPDPQLGFVFLSFSMGQILCFTMILIGLIFVANSIRLNKIDKTIAK